MADSAPLPGNLKDALAEVEDLRQAVAAGIEVAAAEASEVERLRGLLARLEWPETLPGLQQPPRPGPRG